MFRILRVNETDFHQYILKVFIHALKFKSIGEARKGEIRIVLAPGEDWHRLYFRDTGIGISSEVLPHVFEEFYSGKGEGRGTGMGLPFCRRVMNSFGGEVECRSREGEYTELELTFPRVEVGQRESHRVGGDTA